MHVRLLNACQTVECMSDCLKHVRLLNACQTAECMDAVWTTIDLRFPEVDSEQMQIRFGNHRLISLLCASVMCGVVSVCVGEGGVEVFVLRFHGPVNPMGLCGEHGQFA